MADVSRSLREIVALTLVAVAAATQLPTAAWNAGAHYALVRSLADGTPRIDDHLNQSGDIAYVDGHFYAAKSPGLAFLSLPAYAAFVAADAVPATYVTGQGPPGARQVGERAIWQVNLVVVAAFLVLLLLVRATVDRLVPRSGAPVALMLGLGTMLLPFATSYFSHVVSAALAFAAFSLLLLNRGSPSVARVAGAGLLAGLAVFSELPVGLIGAALGLYAVAEQPRARNAVAYGAGAAVGTLPLLAYNAWAFGSPLRNGYSRAVQVLGETGHDVIGANDEGFFGLTYPRPSALVDIVLSGRGLFVLTPVVAVAFLGQVPMWKRARREALLVSGLAVAMLLYNSAYYLPFGGQSPGPRFLVPLLPFLGIPLAFALTSWPRITVAAATVSAFWMTSATIAGPLVDVKDGAPSWLSDIARGSDLSGSILGSGRIAIAAFAVPAVLAVALVAVDRSVTALGDRHPPEPY